MFVICVVVSVSATGRNDFTGFLLKDKNSVGIFSVSSDDTRTVCSVKYTCAFSPKFQKTLSAYETVIIDTACATKMLLQQTYLAGSTCFCCCLCVVCILVPNRKLRFFAH